VKKIERSKFKAEIVMDTVVDEARMGGNLKFTVGTSDTSASVKTFSHD
jgi:hypothetical protein